MRQFVFGTFVGSRPRSAGVASVRGIRRLWCIGLIGAVLSAAALIAGVGVSGAGVGGATIRLGLGDYFYVWDRQGTNGINCWLSAKARPVGLLECYLANSTGQLGNSNSARIDTQATAVFHDDGGPGPEKSLFSARNGPPTAGVPTVAHPAHAYNLHPGDIALVRNTPIRCMNPTNDPGRVECWYYDRNAQSGVKAGTYSFFFGIGGVLVARSSGAAVYEDLADSSVSALAPITTGYRPYRGTAPDIGNCGQNWATDTYSHTFTTRLASRNNNGSDPALRNRDLDLYVTAAGSFVTLAAKSPGSCDRHTNATVGAGIKGTYTGHYHFHYHGDKVRVNNTTSACPSPCTIDNFWSSHISGSRTWQTLDFTATYTAPGHGTWTQTGSTRNGKTTSTSQGDITGRP